jgi:hypothetical protein
MYSAEAQKLFKPTEHKLINNKVVKFNDVKVHEFTMGDVEDPDIYAGQHIYEWQESDAGRWIMENAVEKPFWHRQLDASTFGHRYSIIARLKESDELFWRLKWAKS